MKVIWWYLLESKTTQPVTSISYLIEPYAMSIINKEEEVEPVADTNDSTAKEEQQRNKKEKRKSDRQLTKDYASEVCVTTAV